MRWAITLHGIGNPVGARRVPDDMPLEHDEVFFVGDGAFTPGMVLAEDGASLADPPPPPPERRAVLKSLVIARLIEAGRIAAAKAALDQNAAAWARWTASDKPVVYADDPDAIALLRAIGADPDVILAP